MGVPTHLGAPNHPSSHSRALGPAQNPPPAAAQPKSPLTALYRLQLLPPSHTHHGVGSLEVRLAPGCCVWTPGNRKQGQKGAFKTTTARNPHPPPAPGLVCSHPFTITSSRHKWRYSVLEFAGRASAGPVGLGHVWGGKVS